MEPDRLPREILYGELRGGARKVGRPLLRYKDTIKHDLKAVKIKSNSWEDATANYDAWRLDIKSRSWSLELETMVSLMLCSITWSIPTFRPTPPFTFSVVNGLL